MIAGVVERALDPTIALEVRGPKGAAVVVSAIVDTGFTGALTLRPNQIQELALVQRGVRKAMLANGQIVEARVFRARLNWDAEDRVIQILESSSTPLVGMQLLRGCRLRMDVVPDGSVLIQRLADDAATPT